LHTDSFGHRDDWTDSAHTIADFLAVFLLRISRRFCQQTSGISLLAFIIGVGAQSTFGGREGQDIFARKFMYEKLQNLQNARILHDICPKK